MTTEKPRRKLAAILALDVVGFSRLMHSDEMAAFALVQELGRTVFEPAVTRAGGTIFKHTGDGVLARFDSVHDAFEAGEEIIVGVIDSGQAAVRIGIHLGDVIDSDGDTFGDSVNIACRLESIALQNGICVSERAWSDLRQRNVSFQDLGVQQLKNIETPIRVFMYDSGGSDISQTRPGRSPTWGQWLRSKAVPAGLALLAIAAIGTAIWHFGISSDNGEDARRAAISSALTTVPCSWLRLDQLDQSATRSLARIEGYSTTPPARVQDMLMRQLAGRIDNSVALETSAIAAIPDYACTFLEEASRFRYAGLPRAELVAVMPSSDPVYRARYASKVPENVQLVYDVRIFTRDFSPNAQLFAIDAADGLQYMRPISRLRTRYPEEANVPGGVVHAITWTDQPTPGLFFIVDGPRPIDVQQVQQNLRTMEGLTRFRDAARAGGWQFELVLLQRPASRTP